MDEPGGRDYEPDAATLDSLSFDRVKASLDVMGARYFVDSDGDIGGRWDGNDFYFFFSGEQREILSVRGYWWAHLPVERYDEAVRACNDWNREHLWPKAWVSVDDDGKVRASTVVSVDWEDGVTDAQLIRQIRWGTSTGCHFFDRMDEIFPDARR